MIDIGYALSKLYVPAPDYVPVDSAGPALLSNIYVWRDVRPIPTQAQLDSAVAECEAEVAEGAQSATQIATAETAILPHLRLLWGLPPTDAVYALMGRMMAIKDGASQSVIDSIVDRPTAGAYVTDTSEWLGLTAAERAWEVDVLDMLASVLQLLIARLK